MHMACCPSGSLGGSTVEACQPCPPGHYCDRRGRAEPSGRCAEGYYCPGGQSVERPPQHVSSAGHFCQKVRPPVSLFQLFSVIIMIEYCMQCLPSHWWCITCCMSQFMLMNVQGSYTCWPIDFQDFKPNFHDQTFWEISVYTHEKVRTFGIYTNNENSKSYNI